MWAPVRGAAGGRDPPGHLQCPETPGDRRNLGTGGLDRVVTCVCVGHTWRCSGVIPGSGPHAVPGIELRSLACEVSPPSLEKSSEWESSMNRPEHGLTPL